jgi:phage terminase large subunit
VLALSDRPTLDIPWEELCQWTPKQEIATAAADTYKYTLFGGARGPGKSRWLRWFLLRFLLQAYSELHIPNVHVGLFCEDYRQLADRQISKIAFEFPAYLGRVKETATDGLAFFLGPEWGGGVLALRNLDDPSKYQSAEFAAIGVDELTKNPVETFNTLRGSLRWPGIVHTPFVAGTNPGSIGHLWVKSYWIDRLYPKELMPVADEFAFVKALPADNQHLDPGYWEMLNTLPDDLRRAWVEGDWNVFVGQAFGGFTGRHVTEPFEPPKHWPKWRAVDWGFRNPWCCLWLARDPDIGRVVVYREAYETGLTDRQQAAMILENSPKEEKVSITYADPSMWQTKNKDGVIFTTASEYQAGGVSLTKAANERLQGKRKVDTLLMNLPDGNPGLVVFSTCENLIRTLPALPYDTVQVEDVDTESEDHAYDALRYGLSRVNPKPRAPQPGKVLSVKDALAAIGRRPKGLGGLGSRDL